MWGAVADALHDQKKIHIFCHITSSLLIFSIQFVSSFPLMCVLMFIAYFQMVPTMSLLDLEAMAWTSRTGGDFGKQRLYAAFGYGVGGYMSGAVTSTIGIKWCFNIMLMVACISLFILVRYIPVVYEEADHSHKGQLWSSIRQVFRQIDVLVLFVIALLTGVSGGFIDSYLFLFVFNLSNEAANIVSVYIGVQTLSEIPLFFLASALIKRMGTSVCIAISLVAYGVRYTVYAYMQNPWPLVPIELLHGVTFGLLLTALTNYVYGVAPKGSAGTMIGLLSAFQRGIGAGIASLTGGYIYDDYGPRTIWKISAFGLFPVSLVVVGVFAWFAHRSSARENLQEELLVDVENPADGAKDLGSKD